MTCKEFDQVKYALCFFCAPPEEKIRIINSHDADLIPRIFSKNVEKFVVEDFCFSVACIIIFFKYLIVEEWYGDDDFEDFYHRLSYLMSNKEKDEWSINSIYFDKNWREIRISSSKLLSKLDIECDFDLSFDFLNIINIDEFINSDDINNLM